MKRRPEKKPVGAKLVSRPFSPSLSSLIDSYGAETDRRILEAVNREARHCGFPDGTTFDIQRRMWTMTGKKA